MVNPRDHLILAIHAASKENRVAMYGPFISRTSKPLGLPQKKPAHLPTVARARCRAKPLTMPGSLKQGRPGRTSAGRKNLWPYRLESDDAPGPVFFGPQQFHDRSLIVPGSNLEENAEIVAVLCVWILQRLGDGFPGKILAQEGIGEHIRDLQKSEIVGVGVIDGLKSLPPGDNSLNERAEGLMRT